MRFKGWRKRQASYEVDDAEQSLAYGPTSSDTAAAPLASIPSLSKWWGSKRSSQVAKPQHGAEYGSLVPEDASEDEPEHQHKQAEAQKEEMQGDVQTVAEEQIGPSSSDGSSKTGLPGWDTSFISQDASAVDEAKENDEQAVQQEEYAAGADLNSAVEQDTDGQTDSDMYGVSIPNHEASETNSNAPGSPRALPSLRLRTQPAGAAECPTPGPSGAPLLPGTIAPQWIVVRGPESVASSSSDGSDSDDGGSLVVKRNIRDPHPLRSPKHQHRYPGGASSVPGTPSRLGISQWTNPFSPAFSQPDTPKSPTPESTPTIQTTATSEQVDSIEGPELSFSHQLQPELARATTEPAAKETTGEIAAMVVNEGNQREKGNARQHEAVREGVEETTEADSSDRAVEGQNEDQQTDGQLHVCEENNGIQPTSQGLASKAAEDSDGESDAETADDAVDAAAHAAVAAETAEMDTCVGSDESGTEKSINDMVQEQNSSDNSTGAAHIVAEQGGAETAGHVEPPETQNEWVGQWEEYAPHSHDTTVAVQHADTQAIEEQCEGPAGGPHEGPLEEGPLGVAENSDESTSAIQMDFTSDTSDMQQNAEHAHNASGLEAEGTQNGDEGPAAVPEPILAIEALAKAVALTARNAEEQSDTTSNAGDGPLHNEGPGSPVALTDTISQVDESSDAHSDISADDSTFPHARGPSANGLGAQEGPLAALFEDPVGPSAGSHHVPSEGAPAPLLAPPGPQGPSAQGPLLFKGKVWKKAFKGLSTLQKAPSKKKAPAKSVKSAHKPLTGKDLKAATVAVEADCIAALAALSLDGQTDAQPQNHLAIVSKKGAASKTPSTNPTTNPKPSPYYTMMPDTMAHVANGQMTLHLQRDNLKIHPGLEPGNPLLDRGHYMTTKLFNADDISGKMLGWQQLCYNDDEQFE